MRDKIQEGLSGTSNDRNRIRSCLSCCLSLDDVLKKLVTAMERAEVKRIIYGNPAQPLALPESTHAWRSAWALT